MHGWGPPHVSCLSSCPLDGKEEGLRPVLKTCVKVDKCNSVPALHLLILTSVNSATRNNFSAIYSRGKVEWKRVVADLYIAKFGDNRENLIIAKSLLRCFYMKEKSTGHPLSQGTLGDADATLQKSWSTWTSRRNKMAIQLLKTMATKKLLVCPQEATIVPHWVGQSVWKVSDFHVWTFHLNWNGFPWKLLLNSRHCRL